MFKLLRTLLKLVSPSSRKNKRVRTKRIDGNGKKIEIIQVVDKNPETKTTKINKSKIDQEKILIEKYQNDIVDHEIVAGDNGNDEISKVITEKLDGEDKLTAGIDDTKLIEDNDRAIEINDGSLIEENNSSIGFYNEPIKNETNIFSSIDDGSPIKEEFAGEIDETEIDTKVSFLSEKLASTSLNLSDKKIKNDEQIALGLSSDNLAIDYDMVDITKGDLESLLGIFRRKLENNKLIGFDLLQIAGNAGLKQEIHKKAMQEIVMNYDRRGKFFGDGGATVLVSMIIIALDFYDANYWNHVQDVYEPVYKGRSKQKIEGKLRSLIADYSNNEKRYINFVIRQTITPRTYLDNFIDFCFDIYKNNFKYELVEHINEYLRDIFLEINDYSDLQNNDFVSNNKTYRLINTTKEIIENTEWFSELIAFSGLIIKYIDQVYWDESYDSLDNTNYLVPIFENWIDKNGRHHFKSRKRGAKRTSSWNPAIVLDHESIRLKVPNLIIKNIYDPHKIQITILNDGEVIAQNCRPEIKKVIGGYLISQTSFTLSKPLGKLSYNITHDKDELATSDSQLYRDYIIFNQAGKEISNSSDYTGEISICAKNLDNIENIDIYIKTSNYLLGNVNVRKFDVLDIDGNRVMFSRLQENHLEGDVFSDTSIKYGNNTFELYRNVEYVALITETELADLILENLGNHFHAKDIDIKVTELEHQYHYLFKLNSVVIDGFNSLRIFDKTNNKTLFHQMLFVDSKYESSVYLDEKYLIIRINCIFIKGNYFDCDNGGENLFCLEFEDPHFQDKLYLLPKVNYPVYRIDDGIWHVFSEHISIKDVHPYSKMFIDGIEFDKVVISSSAKNIFFEIEKVSLKSHTFISLAKLMQFSSNDVSSLSVDFIKDGLVIDSINVYYRVVIVNKTFNISYNKDNNQAVIEFEYFGRDQIELIVISGNVEIYSSMISKSPVLIGIDDIQCFKEYQITITGGEADIFSMNSSKYLIYQDTVSFYTSESMVNRCFILTKVWGEYFNTGKKIWQEEWHEFENTNLCIDDSLGDDIFIGRITRQKDGDYLEKVVEVELTSDISKGKFWCSIKEDEDFLLLDNRENSILFDESLMDKHDMPICEYKAKYNDQ